MGDMSKEPSMEEILSSIKRIIAEEGEQAVRTATRAQRRSRGEEPFPLRDEFLSGAIAPDAHGQRALGDEDEVLELTDEVEAEMAVPQKQTKKPVLETAPTETLAASGGLSDESMLSVESELAARHSLHALSAMLVKPQEGSDNTLEGLVRSMLRPMLKEWLDTNLPSMVEQMVAKEIARLTGRAL